MPGLVRCGRFYSVSFSHAVVRAITSAPISGCSLNTPSMWSAPGDHHRFRVASGEADILLEIGRGRIGIARDGEERTGVAGETLGEVVRREAVEEALLQRHHAPAEDGLELVGPAAARD